MKKLFSGLYFWLIIHCPFNCHTFIDECLFKLWLMLTFFSLSLGFTVWLWMTLIWICFYLSYLGLVIPDISVMISSPLFSPFFPAKTLIKCTLESSLSIFFSLTSPTYSVSSPENFYSSLSLLHICTAADCLPTRSFFTQIVAIVFFHWSFCLHLSLLTLVLPSGHCQN